MRHKRKCRGLALFLAGSIVLSSTDAVYAKDAVYTQATISANTVSDNTFEQEYDAGSTVNDADGSGPDNDDLLAEEPVESYTDGEYVIYIQEPDDNAEIVEEVKELDGTQEIAQDSGQAALFVADLTSEQATELSRSEEGGILIEKNIELTASGSNEKKKPSPEKAKSSSEKTQDKEKSSSTKMQNKSKPSSEKTQGKESAHKSNQKSDNGSNSKGHKKSNTETKKTDELLLEDEWNIQMIHADDVTVEAEDTVRIAVLDSGIDLISEVPVTDSINMVEGEQDLPYYMNDMTGHGTAVGDIICQINPQAEIYSIRILDEQNKATLSRVVDAIYLCIDEKVDMINMSFGTNVRSGILEQAVKDAQDAGILLIAAAGNGGAEGGIEYPAAFDGVIAVGAVDTSAVRTEESAVGEQLDLVAPGEQIPAESMFGLCTVVSGTSMAVPHVTGVASVLWQRDKSKSARFIKGLIEETARALGEADEYGSGLVDLEYALASYDEYSEQYEEYEEADSESIETHRIVEPNEAEVLTFEDVN
ncbi:MAG: S8 family serine peptidase, partial [Lachnospiraceae bacterium]|nr:S8 family serine peptidase [Lachnospiraceae bacterium]